MAREKATLTVEVELDAVPGAFDSPESAQYYIQNILTNAIPHYYPRVRLSKD